MASYDGVRPHGSASAKIAQAMAPQLEPFCFDDRYLHH
jgi:hypothetical protein